MERLKVCVIAWNMKAHTWDRYKPQLQAIAKHHDLILATPWEIKCDWIDVVRVPPPSHTYGSLKSMLEYATKVVMALPDFDVLYLRNGGPRRQLLDVFVKYVSKKPACMKLGGDGVKVRFHYVDGGYTLDRWMQDAVDLTSLNNMDMIIPLSLRLKESAEKIILDERRITEPVKLGVDVDRWGYTEPPDKLVVGYAGRISPEKGSKFMEKLFNHCKDIRFEVAGTFEKEDFRFPDNVHFHGVVPYDEMPEFYSRVSLVILPSFPGCEGLPNTVLEAYQSGRPVIVTRNLLPPELPCYGFELPHIVEEWSHHFLHYTLKQYRNMGLMARDWVNWNWDSWEDFGANISKYLWKCYRNHKLEQY